MAGHDRVVPIAPRLAELVDPALSGKLSAARVVVNRRGETPSRQAVWTRLNKLQVRHRLELRSFHSLRHYFLSALVRGGANLEAVRELAGHSKPLTTQRHVHATGPICETPFPDFGKLARNGRSSDPPKVSNFQR